MAYLVRKLIKRDKLSILQDVVDIKKLSADIPTTEFRTTDGNLSTWIINSLEELKEAVLAIAISSSEISKMDFIIMDTDLLCEHALEYKQTYPGQDIAVPELQNTHYDIIDVSVEKLVDCIQVYQTILKEEPEEETFIVRFSAGEIKDLIKDAIIEKRIDESKASKKMKEELERIKQKIT